MNPSDILIDELTALEKDYSRAKRNMGVIYSEETILQLEAKINDYKEAISLLASRKF